MLARVLYRRLAAGTRATQVIRRSTDTPEKISKLWEQWHDLSRQRFLRIISFLVLSATPSLAGCGGASGTSAITVPAAAPNAPAAGLSPTAKPSGTPASQNGSGHETPRPADAFVDSAGINVHLSNFSSFYGNFPAVESLLQGLGVRHVRDGTAIGQPTVCAEDTQLAGAGMHIDLIAATSVDMSALASWVTCWGSSVEAIENPNEYDTSGDPNWVATLTAYAQLLYPAMKPAPIIAPALTTEQAFTALGSLAGSVDNGNMHDYFAGRNPGTPGWGGTDAFGEYGSLAYNKNLAALVSGGKPVVATETGYSDDADQYAIPPVTKAHYTLRTLLEHWNAGVVRTYFYELADEGAQPYSHYGFVDANGNPKPAYVALKNFLAHLADPGGSFTLNALNYTLNAPSSVHHTLLEKRDRRYILVLWVEQPEWDPISSTTVPLAPQTVTLSFSGAPVTLAATVFDDGGNVSTNVLPVAAGTATLQVTGSPTIVDITQ